MDGHNLLGLTDHCFIWNHCMFARKAGGSDTAPACHTLNLAVITDRWPHSPVQVDWVSARGRSEQGLEGGASACQNQ